MSMHTNFQFSIFNFQNRGFTTPSEAQYESQLSYLPSAGGAKARRAFTLIETLVAVSILTLSIAAPLFTADRAIVSAETARDQLTASYLAQEGIEYVRAMRDDEFLTAYSQPGATNVSTTAWTNFLNGVDSAAITQCRTTTCTLDPSRLMGTGSDLALERCSMSGNPYPVCAPLYLSNDIYTVQPIGTKQVFTRTIQAIDISATDERIISTVSWSFHETPYSVTIYDHLTPWQ